MMIMSTYGGFLVPPVQKDSTGAWEDENIGEGNNKAFKQHDPFLNNFFYRHNIDDHKNMRHD